MTGEWEGPGLPRPCILLRADKEHCFETAARKEYERLALSILRGEEKGEEAGERLDLLREFLEKADFRSLRASSEARIKEKGEARVLVFRRGEEVSCVFIDR